MLDRNLQQKTKLKGLLNKYNLSYLKVYKKINKSKGVTL
jgi:hypothetical protein